MRVVFMADTHLFLDDLRVPDGDAVVHAGDMLRAGTLAELEEHAAFWSALPHRHKIVVPGNHDGCFAREEAAARRLLAGTTVLIDEATTIEGLRFYGSPWQPEFNGWAFNLPRGAPLAERWARIPAGLDVLITHGPPFGFGDLAGYAPRSMGDGRSGCVDLLARVRAVRPRLHVFGHIHQDGGAWLDDGVQLANVTTWECERACTVFDVGETITPVFVPPARASEMR